MAEQNNSFPTISEKNWWTIRERFKSSLPSVVSTTYIKSLLSMANDNSANSNVISPLKRIGLIDDENKPTALANDWRIDDKYNTCLLYTSCLGLPGLYPAVQRCAFGLSTRIGRACLFGGFGS